MPVVNKLDHTELLLEHEALLDDYHDLDKKYEDSLNIINLQKIKLQAQEELIAYQRELLEKLRKE
jgi:hypothetical protein